MSVIALPPVTRRRSLAASPAAVGSLAPVAALTVLAAALRFALIGHQGYWFDEGNTVLLVHLSPGKMLGLIPQSESTPPLYYGVAWVWARIFGFGEVGLRSLSAVAGVATVPVLWCAARRLASDRAAVIVAALTACNPLLVWYSQEARSYSLLVLMSALTLWTFALMLDEPSARRVVGWVVAGALALVTHYYAVLAVAPEAVWLLYVHRRRRPVQVGVGALVVCGLALLPYALNQNASGHASWISAAPLGRRVGELVPQFALGFQSPARGVLEPVAIVLLVLALVLLGWRAAPMERRAGLLAGGLALAGLVLNLLLIAGGVDDLITRNVLAIWPAAAVAVAVGLAASRARAAGVAAALALCALGVTTVIGVDADTARQKPDWRVVARALGPAPAVGQGRVVLIQHYRDLLPLSLSLPTLKFVPRGGATVSQLDVVSFTSPPSAGFCWWGSACNLWPSRIQRAYAIPGFRVVSRTRVRQFTVVRMVARRPVHVTASLVAPALTATRLHEDDLLLQRP